MAITKVTTSMKTAPTSAEVTAHVTAFDDVPVRNDIATLALHSAIADNKAAYNLSNSFIDQFEDSTGIHVNTNTNRNAAEYMGSISPGTGNDSYTKLLLHMDGADDGTTFTDSSATARTVTRNNMVTKTGVKKFGTASGYFDGVDDWLNLADHADWDFGSGLWTIDLWFYTLSSAPNNDGVGIGQYDGSTAGQYEMYLWTGGTAKTHMNFHYGGWASPSLDSQTTYTLNNWHHVAFVRDTTTTAKLYMDGVLKHTITINSAMLVNNPRSEGLRLGGSISNSTGEYYGYMDEFRWSKGIARTLDSNDQMYISSGTDFTVPTIAYGEDVVNAAGNYTSTTQAATASVSTMGIVVLYKNNAGTATLNTDLVAQVSANGGTNYANATLVAGGTFSTGINIAAVSGVSVTAGTTPKYKISFANQSSGSKETQVHGVALLY